MTPWHTSLIPFCEQGVHFKLKTDMTEILQHDIFDDILECNPVNFDQGGTQDRLVRSHG